jgi:hypothetical protein
MNGSRGYQRKTNIYVVMAKDGNIKLGEIRWFGRWRKYCFYPWSETIYEETCLRDIADFLTQETAAYKTKKRRSARLGR